MKKSKKALEKEAQRISEMTNRVKELGSVDIHLSNEAVAELVRELRKGE